MNITSGDSVEREAPARSAIEDDASVPPRLSYTPAIRNRLQNLCTGDSSGA